MSLDTDAGRDSVRALCKAFSISRAAYYRAQENDHHKVVPLVSRRAAAPASSATAPGTPVCSGQPRVWASALQAAIRRLCAEHRAWGVRKIWATLRREGMRVGYRRVWATMKALGLTLSPDRERGVEPRRGQVVTEEPNRRLATDLTTVYTRKAGLVAIVPVIDCGCRSLLALSASKSQTGPAILAPVREALETVFETPRGVPMGLELRTDHGPQYTGADCANLCRE